MVVQPLGVSFAAEGTARGASGVASSCDAGMRPAWRAVEARQRREAESYLLVGQPEHARLSGDLAANFTSPQFPTLSPEMTEAIGAHDEGWSLFPAECANEHSTPMDRGEPMLTTDGKPRSFIEFAPADFIRAWSGSIDRAASLSSVGGVLVSRHFASLAEHSLRTIDHPHSDAELLREFLRQEQHRQCEMLVGNMLSEQQLGELLKVLQFCDLLSLALCCGITEEIVFPQCFSGRNIQMRFRDGVYELSPSPFQREQSGGRDVAVTVYAREYPGSGSHRLSYVLR
jgi:hypothetical protein